MRRIAGPTSVENMFGPGKNGFRNGNKALGIQATFLTAEVFNAWQEEKANFVEAAGLTLDPDDNTQMLQAARIILSNADMIARFTTIGNIALNGLGVQAGGDWTANLTANDFILVKDQAAPANNGWYRAQAGAWTRVVYLDEDNEVSAGMLTKVSEGATLADSIWMLTTDNPIDVGTTALNFGRKDSFSGVRYYASGTPLPTSNIGPIWHDDYNSIMKWQVFNANGAAYAGYVSVLVGSILADSQSTPRTGYVKSGTTNLSRVTYAALRGWAMHNGIMVAPGVWGAGMIALCDNADGTTMKVMDVRSEFPRFWDDGRGVDTSRVFGSGQTQDIQPHNHVMSTGSARYGSGGSHPGSAFYASGGDVGYGGTFSLTSNNNAGTETRPRNVAFAAMVKF